MAILSVNEIFVKVQTRSGARVVRWEALLDLDSAAYWAARERAAREGYRITDNEGNVI